ncbi:homeobox protein NOBOX-like [Stigmatopora nigra]
MEMTQRYSTRRSIHYISRGRGQAASLPVPPNLDSVDGCPLPPAPPKKKPWARYSTDHLKYLEASFQEEHYPDADKRKIIAATVGVTPEKIKDWFHNRRGRRRKLERLASCRGEPPMTRARWNSTRHHSQSLLPIMQNAVSITMAPVFSGHFSAEMPMLESVAPVPPFIILSTQTQPSSSQLLATSPGQSRVGEPPDFHHHPTLSPLPPTRTRLPLLTASATYDLNIAPPPLYMDDGTSVDQGESLLFSQEIFWSRYIHCVSSLFDLSDKLDLLAPSNQNNTQLSFPLWTSYPNRKIENYLFSCPQNQRQLCSTSRRNLTCLTLMSHVTGGVGSYPSYPRPNVYTQPAVQQLAPNSPTGFAGAARDHQVPSSPSSAGGSALPPSSTLLPSRFRVSPLLPSHPRVSTLLPSRLRVSTLCHAASRIECDSPCEIHSHFNWDFSVIHF